MSRYTLFRRSSGARIGAWAWASSVQFFIAQFIVARTWQTPYSMLHHNVSDLGATECMIIRSIYVCSPWHTLMNLSFIVLGLTMSIGAWLVSRYFEHHRALFIGFWCVGITGVGTAIIGLSPENVNLTVHQIGAFFPFTTGNIGMMLIGGALISQTRRNWLGWFSLISGLVGLIAAVLFYQDIFLGLGVGGMERLVVYPLPAWLTIFGLACLAGVTRRRKYTMASS